MADPIDREAVTPEESRLLRRVRRQLALWSGGVTLVLLVLLGAVLYIAVDRSLSASGTAELVARAGQITGDRPDPDVDLPSGGFIFGGRGSGTFAMIVNEAGRPVRPNQIRIPDGLPVLDSIAAARTSNQRDVRETAVAATSVRVLTEPVAFRGRQVYLQIVGDRTAEERTLRVLVLVLLIGGGVALLAASSLGVAYASRALVPIRRSLVGQREALRRQREFAADASHELRTPLTVIRASVDDLQRHPSEPVSRVGTALTDIRDEVDHLTSMVEDLLLLARSDSGAIELERVSVDLGDVAASGAAALGAVAAAKGVVVTVDPEPAEVLGDPTRLRQLVVILVDNAVHHVPAGSHVTVRVRADASQATVVVEDDGPGIAPEDLPRVFDRFYRAPGTSGDGTGLGLAIASWIVERHAGRIEAANRPAGGAALTVRLPRSRVAAP